MPESSLITIRRIRWSASRTSRLSIAAVAAIVATCFRAFPAIVSAAESKVVIECCNLFDPASGTMLPEVTSQPGHRRQLDLNHPLCTSLVAELAERRVFVDPTLAVFRNMILLRRVPSE